MHGLRLTCPRAQGVHLSLLLRQENTLNFHCANSGLDPHRMHRRPHGQNGNNGTHTGSHYSAAVWIKLPIDKNFRHGHARIAVWTRTGCIAGPMVKTGIMAIMLRQKQDSPWAIPTAQLDCIQCCSLEMARVLSGTRRVRKVAWLTSELQASSRQQVLCEASVRLLHLELQEEISAAV